MKQLFALATLILVSLGCTTSPATSPGSRLETTPRHDEWIDLSNGARKVRTYVVYPERSTKAPVVVVIHENRGLNAWARTLADQLAEAGYIAVAPDFLSGTAPGGGNTADFPTEDAAREGISRLPKEQVVGDINAAVAYARLIPAANGKVSVAGFCWGGSRAWDAANQIENLEAVYVFYGTGPSEAAGVSGIDAAVYGFYGGADERVNATIPATEAAMKAAGKRFEPMIYEEAGHAYMRAGELPDASEANRRAREQSWKRWLALLKR